MKRQVRVKIIGRQEIEEVDKVEKSFLPLIIFVISAIIFYLMKMILY